MSTSQDELKRILRMVEEKKISAEDAARLIEALKPGRKKSEGVFTIIEGLTERFSGFTKEKTLSFKGRHRLELKGLSGDIEINGAESDEISISCDGFVKAVEDTDRVRVKALSGDIRASVPEKINLSVASASGDVEINQISGKLSLKAAAGDVSVKDFEGEFDISGAFGDLDLDLSHLDQGNVKAVFGDMTVGLNPDDDLEIEVKLKRGGKIINEADLDIIEETKGYLKAKLNKGKNRLRIEGRGGTVVLKRR